LSVVTMPPDSPPVAPAEHVCGYLCDCGVDRSKVAAAVRRGVRPSEPLPVKRAA
jgi:hypothetical protein